jgi:hexosaminidase
MKINIIGDLDGLYEGIEILGKEINVEVSEDGIPVKVVKTPGSIEVSLENGQGIIKYSEKIHFFRALGLFVEAAEDKESFSIIEEPQFSLNGAMLDVSRNAVLKVSSIKYMIRKMAVMGLDLIMLYTEDTYEIKSIPYFGYMRGRYTAEELRECDDYAFIFGIEIIPCIQTLAHLTEALKWRYASEIRDTEDILLVGEEKTYQFIEDMIKAVSEVFRSKKIHIGMDEAHNLGLGKYLDKNGYRRRFDIMNEHLFKVVKITEKYGLEPMIWSDMYFRLASKTGNYYDLQAVIPEDVIEKYPREVQLVYWDYYHNDEETYVDFIRRHKKFNDSIVFAGGIWTWAGNMINYNKTFITTNAALSACKKEGVREVFATMWGDNGAETSLLSALLGLQLFAEHGYAENIDIEKLKKRFKFCTGGDYDSFVDLSLLDAIPGTENANIMLEVANPSKFLLWQDILIGLFDKDIEGLKLKEHYLSVSERMSAYSSLNSDFCLLFKFAEKLAKVLSIKGEIGIDLKSLYDTRDTEALKRVAEVELPKLYEEVNRLRTIHREQWFKLNKSFGWEIIDIRYGGLLARIDSIISRLLDYTSGKVSIIEELEEERLSYYGQYNLEERPGRCNRYSRIISASPLG